MKLDGIAFHHPFAFWFGCLLVLGGVLAHMPMFMMGEHTHWQMVGMPMTTEMWLGMLAATRISSMGGMSAAASVPMAALLVGRWDVVIASAGMALLVLWRHRANIDRLMRGEEPKVGSRKPDDSAHG